MDREIDYLKRQLNNVLRGDAMIVKDDTKSSPEKRIKEMEAIEAMTNYIDNYEKNLELIRKVKEEAERMEDDGR